MYELIVDGGEEAISLGKESGRNFWTTLILFIAHAHKYNHSRVDHLHLSSISLDKIFN